MDVASLLVRIGVDASQLQAAIEGVLSNFQSIQSRAIDLGRSVGDSLQQGEEGAEEMGHAVRDTSKDIAEMGKAFTESLTRVTGRIVTTIVSFTSLTSLFKGYIDDIKNAGKELGLYNDKQDEEERKRRLLARITKEDIERYVKYEYALHKFHDTVQSVGNAFLRSFGPAFDKIISIMSKWADFIARNEDNLVRFFKVVAGVITVALIPALIRLGATILANPLTWFIALLAGVALVIDDLIVYIEGGESALEDYWKMFGTGEEIAAKLKSAWETVKSVWEKNKTAILAFLGVFVGFKIFETIIGLVTRLGATIKALFLLILRNPIVLIIALIADLITYIITGNSFLDKFWKKIGSGQEILQKLKKLVDTIVPVLVKGFNFVLDIVTAVLSAIADGISWIIDRLLELPEAISRVVTYLKNTSVRDFFRGLLSSLVNLFNSFVQTILSTCSRLWQSVKDITQAVWASILNSINSILNRILSEISNLGTALVSMLSSLWERVRALSVELWESIKTAIINTFTGLLDGIKAVGNQVLDLCSNTWKSIKGFWDSINLFESGRKLIGTLIDGIKSMASSLVSSIEELFAKVRQYLPFSNAKKGPFTELTRSGQKLIETIALGTRSASNDLVNSIYDIFARVREFLPFSDAHTGPFSQLTLAGQRFITTFLGGILSQGAMLIGIVSYLFGRAKKKAEENQIQIKSQENSEDLSYRRSQDKEENRFSSRQVLPERSTQERYEKQEILERYEKREVDREKSYSQREIIRDNREYRQEIVNNSEKEIQKASNTKSDSFIDALSRGFDSIKSFFARLFLGFREKISSNQENIPIDKREKENISLEIREGGTKREQSQLAPINISVSENDSRQEQVNRIPFVEEIAEEFDTINQNLSDILREKKIPKEKKSSPFQIDIENEETGEIRQAKIPFVEDIAEEFYTLNRNFSNFLRDRTKDSDKEVSTQVSQSGSIFRERDEREYAHNVVLPKQESDEERAWAIRAAIARAGKSSAEREQERIGQSTQKNDKDTDFLGSIISTLGRVNQSFIKLLIGEKSQNTYNDTRENYHKSALEAGFQAPPLRIDENGPRSDQNFPRPFTRKNENRGLNRLLEDGPKRPAVEKNIHYEKNTIIEHKNDGFLSGFWAGFSSFSDSVLRGLETIFSPFVSGFREISDTATENNTIPTSQQLVLASVPSSITESTYNQNSTSSVTTSIGEIQIQTQANNARDIAVDISSALRQSINGRMQSTLAMSGVRQ